MSMRMSMHSYSQSNVCVSVGTNEDLTWWTEWRVSFAAAPALGCARPLYLGCVTHSHAQDMYIYLCVCLCVCVSVSLSLSLSLSVCVCVNTHGKDAPQESRGQWPSSLTTSCVLLDCRSRSRCTLSVVVTPPPPQTRISFNR